MSAEVRLPPNGGICRGKGKLYKPLYNRYASFPCVHVHGMEESLGTSFIPMLCGMESGNETTCMYMYNRFDEV